MLETQSVKTMFQSIALMAESIKTIEKQLAELTEDDEMENRIMTICGCETISAWSIKAYTEDIGSFANAKNMLLSVGLFHGYGIQLSLFITES